LSGEGRRRRVVRIFGLEVGLGSFILSLFFFILGVILALLVLFYSAPGLEHILGATMSAASLMMGLFTIIASATREQIERLGRLTTDRFDRLEKEVREGFESIKAVLLEIREGIRRRSL